MAEPFEVEARGAGGRGSVGRGSLSNVVVPEQSASFLRTRRASEAIVTSFVGTLAIDGEKAHEDDVIRVCGVPTTGNMRVLGLTATLFVIITAAQTVAAAAAHSDALMADAVSMGVDSGTYFLNMFAELARGRPVHQPLELAIALVSQVVLVYFTFDVMLEAMPGLSEGGRSEEGEDVNPYIILVFAVWGLLFDFISLYAFMKNQKGSEDGLGVNMQAALMHVGADFLRSGTTFVLGVLILVFNFEGGRTDAIATMIVSGTILLGALFALVEWAREFMSYMRGAKVGEAREVDIL